MVSEVKRILTYKIHFSKPVLRKSVSFEQSEYEIYDVHGNSTENKMTKRQQQKNKKTKKTKRQKDKRTKRQKDRDQKFRSML